MLQNLRPYTKVDAEQYECAVANLKTHEEEIERLEQALARAQENISALEKLKDREQVKALKRRSASSEALDEEFESLVTAVKEARPDNTSITAFKHLILDHFGLAGEIDWYNDKYDFEQAIKYGLLSKDDYSVLWDRPKLKRLAKALDAVQTFLNSEEGQEYQTLQDADVPMEPDDLGFWEYHLSI